MKFLVPSFWWEKANRYRQIPNFYSTSHECDKRQLASLKFAFCMSVTLLLMFLSISAFIYCCEWVLLCLHVSIWLTICLSHCFLVLQAGYFKHASLCWGQVEFLFDPPVGKENNDGQSSRFDVVVRPDNSYLLSIYSVSIHSMYILLSEGFGGKWRLELSSV